MCVMSRADFEGTSKPVEISAGIEASLTVPAYWGLFGDGRKTISRKPVKANVAGGDYSSISTISRYKHPFKNEYVTTLNVIDHKPAHGRLLARIIEGRNYRRILVRDISHVTGLSSDDLWDIDYGDEGLDVTKRSLGSLVLGLVNLTWKRIESNESIKA